METKNDKNNWDLKIQKCEISTNFEKKFLLSFSDANFLVNFFFFAQKFVSNTRRGDITCLFVASYSQKKKHYN